MSRPRQRGCLPSRRQARRPGGSRGFTLIELMVAVSIVAMVSTLVWSTIRQTSSTKQRVEAQALRYRTVRIALDRMARELSMAFVSQNEDTSQPEKRTRFVGKINGKMHDLTFSYYGHQRLYEDSHEADTAVVSYFTEVDKQTRAQNLWHRESRRLGYLKPEDLAGEQDIVCDNVVSLVITYWDSLNKQWREEWNTTSADGQPDRLPSKVKIVLTVLDERGQEVPFTTQARVMMQEPLNLNASAATAAAASKTSNSSGSSTASTAAGALAKPAASTAVSR